MFASAPQRNRTVFALDNQHNLRAVKHKNRNVNLSSNCVNVLLIGQIMRSGIVGVNLLY